MPAEIIEYGKLTDKRNKFIYFNCTNPKCECKFKVRDNDKDLNIIITHYGFFFKKRAISYYYKCPECSQIITMIEYPDEDSDI